MIYFNSENVSAMLWIRLMLFSNHNMSRGLFQNNNRIVMYNVE